MRRWFNFRAEEAIGVGLEALDPAVCEAEFFDFVYGFSIFFLVYSPCEFGVAFRHIGRVILAHYA